MDSKYFKKIVVLGGGGFIGGHLITKLKLLGHWVRGVDIKYNEFKKTDADEFIITDLRDPVKVDIVIDETIDEIYQLAADMGGSTYINTGEHDSDVMHNSCLINLNVLKTCSQKNVKKIFYSSSACVYPEYNQLDPDNPKCSEDSTYPAEPDSEYGWEKLFSERLYFVFNNDFPKLDIRVARFHNIYGPYGTYEGGKEKAPAAFCRKVAVAKDGDVVEVYGDGKQTRSFLLVDECIEGILRLMESDFKGPVNIGSNEMVNMNDFMNMIIKLSGKKLTIKNTAFHGVGVRSRNSDNKLIKEKLDWEPNYPLEKGIKITYDWINSKINNNVIKKILICDLPQTWKSGAGFFTYPIMYINCILYCKFKNNDFYHIPEIDFDNDITNKYIDDKGIFWDNYFIVPNINKNLNYEKVKLSDDEYNNIHHNFGIQTYPYGGGIYKDYKNYYDKPYTNEIKKFYLKNRKTGNEMINTHIKINTNINTKVNSFFSSLPNYDYLIGVHIRGTDKQFGIGGRKIKPEEYFIYIDYIMKKNKNSLIFLATDDKKYYDIMNEKYKKKVASQFGVLRDENNILNVNMKNNIKKGTDVLVDCLCLSKCNFLIHQSSAVSEFAIYFNINLHENSFNLQYDNSEFINL